MTEGTKDAMILISTSWQALGRTNQCKPETLICDCTIVILFASFFIEANLNYIVETLNMKKEMTEFLNNNQYPGLKDKLAWFYNEFIASDKALTKKELYSKGIKSKLTKRYPGFSTLYQFRNDLSHGVINSTARSLPKVVKLRQQAKDIVEDLFIVTARAGYVIERDKTYQEAIQQI